MHLLVHAITIAFWIKTQSTKLHGVILTYSMEHSPSWEANRFEASQEIPCILWSPKVLTTFTSARHLSLSWASSIQSIPPNPTPWRSILILFSHQRLVLPTGLFPSHFPTKTLYTPLPSTKRATCHAHLILLDFITSTVLGEQYRSLSSSLCSFLHSPVTSSPLGPNILLNTLFSSTLSLRSFLNVSDQVSHPYQTTGKIILLYILIFKFLDSKLEDKWLCTEWQQAFPDFNLLLISSWIEFWFFPNIWTFLSFQRNYYHFSYCDFVVSRHGHVLSFSAFTLVQSPY